MNKDNYTIDYTEELSQVITDVKAFNERHNDIKLKLVISNVKEMKIGFDEFDKANITFSDGSKIKL